MNDGEKQATVDAMLQRNKKELSDMLEDAYSKEWESNSDGIRFMSTKATAFELIGVVISSLFSVMNFKKKFRIVIEHDPDDEAGNVYFKYSNIKKSSQVNSNLNFTKKYQYQSPNGSDTEIIITANIENSDKDDLQDILHNFASHTRNFYISLGNEINNKP